MVVEACDACGCPEYTRRRSAAGGITSHDDSMKHILMSNELKMFRQTTRGMAARSQQTMYVLLDDTTDDVTNQAPQH
jgi:hypothetical protein